MASWKGEDNVTIPPPGDAAVILEAGRNLAAAQIEYIEDVPHLLIRPGTEVRPLPELMAAPSRARGVVQCATVEAFLGMCERLGTESSVVYADRAKQTITAVIDDHSRSDKDAPSVGWRQHRVCWRTAPSVAWTAWREIDGKTMPQAQFLEHLEDRRGDVIVPDHAELMEIIRAVSGREDVVWSSAIDTQTGAVRLLYNQDISASSSSGAVVVPKELKLSIEVYRDLPKSVMTCRLRYRLRDRKLVVGIVIDKLDEVEEAAFRLALADVRAGLDESVLLVEAAAD